MAKRKTPRKKSTTRKKSASRSSTKKKNELSTAGKYIGIILLSALITLFISQFRYEISNAIYKYDCVDVKAGDYPTQLVYNAINVHHQIRENPNKKEELLGYLSDRVIWFRKSRTETSKNKIRTFSIYDEFCFSEYPEFDNRDEMNNNYQMNFIGVHRYRNIDTVYSKAEKYYCEILDGKIKKLYPVPVNNLELESLGRVNSIYNYFSIYTFLFVLGVFLLINYLTYLPETFIRFIGDLFKRFIPGL